MLYRSQFTALFTDALIKSIKCFRLCDSAILTFMRHFVSPLCMLDTSMPILSSIMFPAKTECDRRRRTLIDGATSNIHREISSWKNLLICPALSRWYRWLRKRTTDPIIMSPGEKTERSRHFSSISCKVPDITVSSGSVPPKMIAIGLDGETP